MEETQKNQRFVCQPGPTRLNARGSPNPQTGRSSPSSKTNLRLGGQTKSITSPPLTFGHSLRDATMNDGPKNKRSTSWALNGSRLGSDTASQDQESDTRNSSTSI